MSDFFDDLSNSPPAREEPKPVRAGSPGIPSSGKPASGGFTPPVAGEQTRMEFRGVGEVHKREPIAAFVEVLKRGPKQDGEWEFVRAFSRNQNQKAEFAFHVMQSVPTTTIQKGGHKSPGRETHPQFSMFNTSLPEQARTIHCKLIHFRESDCYRNFLGTFMPPPGQNRQETGWWCRGDGKDAQRWVGGAHRKIKCPDRLCEYRQEAFGPSRNTSLCKPNLTLIAQFNWPDEIMPNVVFQWDSKSWNNIANCEGLFQLISNTAENLGYKKGEFPVFGLPFTMNLKTRVKGQRRFPEVSFSVEGDLMKWMSSMHQHFEKMKAAKGALMLEGPKPLAELPPGGFTQDDMDAASQATLDPNYKPANERGLG